MAAAFLLPYKNTLTVGLYSGTRQHVAIGRFFFQIEFFFAHMTLWFYFDLVRLSETKLFLFGLINIQRFFFKCIILVISKGTRTEKNNVVFPVTRQTIF